MPPVNISAFLLTLLQLIMLRRRIRVRRERQRRLRRAVVAILARRSQTFRHQSQYCQVNRCVPVLAMCFDGQSDLRPDFRLSRPTILHLIEILRSPSDHGWGFDLEILVFLFWLASATSYRVVSRAFGIPRSTIHDIVHKVSKTVNGLKNRVICLPPQDDLARIGAGFENLAGSAAFNHVVGSIDGCHIRIKPPSHDAQCYFNRKLFYSVQMQAVCDHQCQFLDVFIGYPGSVHDSRVLKNSPLFVQSLYPPEGYCLLGDGGYPCLSQPITLITPYREPVRGAVEARFNRHHSKARSIIERAFGIMKARWRSVFFKALEVSPVFSVEVVACCAILHNFCLRDGDTMEPVEEALRPDDGDGQLQPDSQCGERLRVRMAAALSAPVENLPALDDHDYI
ncbi:putative nuclease HARBI1 [Notolabrus celidotus]|uniref:putative nuclease HARBI1 n=1 Tax=Notolabrus celidotus TaxID=1203425 RepID=UPI00148F453C|nr:putative nuclease HARBI1 [Notolabrus celidotus]